MYGLITIIKMSDCKVIYGAKKETRRRTRKEIKVTISSNYKKMTRVESKIWFCTRYCDTLSNFLVLRLINYRKKDQHGDVTQR